MTEGIITVKSVELTSAAKMALVFLCAFIFAAPFKLKRSISAFFSLSFTMVGKNC